MKFDWQEIAEQHAAKIRELEEYVSELRYALDLATGSDSNYSAWRTWVHERDCPAAHESHDEPCRCDGGYVIDIVQNAMSKRI